MSDFNIRNTIVDEQTLIGVSETTPIFNASKLRGVPLSLVPPSDGEYLVYNNIENTWESLPLAQNRFTNRVFIGSDAGETAQDVNTVAIGVTAGQLNQSDGSTAIGFEAGKENQGTDCVAIGYEAGRNSQGNLSVAIGNRSGIDDQGTACVAIGESSGRVNQSDDGVAIGNNAGEITQGTRSVAIGYDAGNDDQGIGGISIGNSAGRLRQGVDSVSIGVSAGEEDQESNCIAIGFEAGRINQSEFSVAIGHLSGNEGQGSSSVAIGESSGRENQGSNAVAIGNNTGQNNQGNNSVAIGYNAGRNDQHDDSIVICGDGTELDTEGGNRFYVKPIRNDVTFSDMLLYSTSTSEISYGNIATVTSDERLKVNSQPLSQGLDLIRSLQPRSYLKGGKFYPDPEDPSLQPECGLIAQEIVSNPISSKIAGSYVVSPFIDSVTGIEQPYQIRHSSFHFFTMQAVKELDQLVQTLFNENRELVKRIASMEEKISKD